MSNRNYVKVVYVDPAAIDTYGYELSKLALILTKEWAHAMSKYVQSMLEKETELNALSDKELVLELHSGSEEIIEALSMGVQIGSGNNFDIVNAIIGLVRKSISTPQQMFEALGQRSPGIPLSIALRHNYPFIVMPVVNSSDIEYSVHFDLNEFTTFFVIENNLGDAVTHLSSFPIDPAIRDGLMGEDFYGSREDDSEEEGSVEDDTPVLDPIMEAIERDLQRHLARAYESESEAANDDSYEEEDTPIMDRMEREIYEMLRSMVENQKKSNPVEETDDSVVERTSEIEYIARIYDVFGNLEDERVGNATQLESLLNWAKAVAELDGLRYSVVRAVTTTVVSVEEEIVTQST